jgi:hypothetical protein
MGFRNLSFLLQWLATLALLANLLALAYWVNEQVTARRDAEATDKGAAKKRDDDPGDGTLPTRVAESLLLEVEQPKLEERWVEPVTVYGQVVPNPLATVEIRAPFAGTLRAGGGRWPQPGQWLKAGDVLGWVDIRVAPQDRIDLQNKLNEADQKHKGALDILQLKKAGLDRFEAAFQSAPKSVPLRELEEARREYTEANTQEALAKDAVNLWKDALAEIDRAGPGKSGNWSQALKVPAAGEVTDLVGRAGTAVEAGGLVLRLVDFRRPLVRLDLSPEVVLKGPPRAVELFAITPSAPALNGVRNQPQAARPAHKLRATLTGTAPGVNPASQFASYLYETDADSSREESESMRHSIMMVSHWEHLQLVEGMPWGRELVFRGARERLAPILMTALVTALGLLPIALGSGEAGREIEGPMALVILGGLVTSTALNLLVLPVLYRRFGSSHAVSPRAAGERVR